MSLRKAKEGLQGPSMWYMFVFQVGMFCYLKLARSNYNDLIWFDLAAAAAAVPKSTMGNLLKVDLLSCRLSRLV